MRKILVLLLALMLCLTTSCNQKKKPFFDATVLELTESSILVKPNEGEDLLKSADKISVSTDVVSKDGVPELKVGDEIRIVHDGYVLQSYPAMLGKVYAIYLTSDLKE